MGIGEGRTSPRASVQGDWWWGDQANAALPGGRVIGDWTKGNRDATSGVRPAAVSDELTERVDPPAPLLVFNSYAVVVGRQAELCARSICMVKIAKRFNRSAGCTR